MLNNTLNKSLSNGLNSFIDSFKNGIDDVDDIWKSFATSFLETWLDVVKQITNQKLMELLLGDLSDSENGSSLGTGKVQGLIGSLLGNKPDESKSKSNSISFGFETIDSLFNSGYNSNGEFQEGIKNNLTQYKGDLEFGILGIFDSVMQSGVQGGSSSGSSGFWGTVLKIGAKAAMAYFTGGTSLAVESAVGAGAAGAAAGVVAARNGLIDVPNYSLGTDDPIALYNGYQKALKKENHPLAFPAVLHKGEVVLSDLNGDAQTLKEMKSNGIWDAYKKGYNAEINTSIPNYRQGTISNDYQQYSNNYRTNNNNSRTTNINVMTKDYQGFRKNENSIRRRQMLEDQRNNNRNG